MPPAIGGHAARPGPPSVLFAALLAAAAAALLPAVASAAVLSLRGPAGLTAGGGSASALRAGDEVVLCGLTGHTTMNGHKARVLKFNQDSGRWTVRLQGKSRAQLDAAHLMLVPHGAEGRDVPSCPSLSLAPSQAADVHVHVLAAGLHNSTKNPIVDNKNFFEGCSEACDHCFAEHLQYCSAICREGCQVYCDESKAGIPGCSQEEAWWAMPGSTPSCTWDHGKNTSCNRYRNCASESSDGCPEAYLY